MAVDDSAFALILEWHIGDSRAFLPSRFESVPLRFKRDQTKPSRYLAIWVCR